METSPPICKRLLNETSDATKRRLFIDTSPWIISPLVTVKTLAI